MKISELKKAYVFQEQYTGLQIFVYQANSIDHAKSKLAELGLNTDSWVYLCQKVALEADE